MTGRTKTNKNDGSYRTYTNDINGYIHVQPGDKHLQTNLTTLGHVTADLHDKLVTWLPKTS